MDDSRSATVRQSPASNRRRSLRSHRNCEEGGASDSEAAANASSQRPQPPRRRSTRSRPEPSSADVADSTPTLSSTTVPLPRKTAPVVNTGFALSTVVSTRSRESRFSLFSQGQQSRRGRDSAVGSPSRGDLSPRQIGLGLDGAPGLSPYEIDLSIALEEGLVENDLRNAFHPLRRTHTQPHTSASYSETSTFQPVRDIGGLGPSDDEPNSYSSNRATPANFSSHQALPGWLVGNDHDMGGSSKRAREKIRDKESKDLLNTLERHGAITAMLYHATDPDPEANDIWPNFRNRAKLPARYASLNVSRGKWGNKGVDPSTSRLQVATQDRYNLRGQNGGWSASAPETIDPQSTSSTSTGRPFWQLPVELVEQIIEHLNRDDVKSLRLVSRELNEYTSQAAFRTVVVPFNTEIYGMLGQEVKPDRKGKKRARISRPEYCWKNANGDEVYNGHGLDVFRGFGRHILRYGMSFEMNEDSLSAPPSKSTTEQKTSFWGNYDWPFEEYRRFDAVAGLESAADETPRMKTAFSELTKVKELALTVNSGLGWLNGPDLSIRARILQTPPSIFGSRQNVPDRRSQAQQELWHHIEDTHVRAGDDARTASLYRLEGARPLTEVQESRLLAATQPSLPFLESHIPHEATPHDTADAAVSQPLDDTSSLDRHVLRSSSVNAGILFTSSTLQHNDAAQVLSPIVPATLTKAQKEWLLETEWAQRAFLSSYMLSVIDNRTTFHLIHTLNISSLADRYISMLDRADFWDALPSLQDVTLMVIPGWRTVEKDEAGFVDTPRVDPAGHVDTFCGLLQAQVAPRSKITRLTVGFAAGGEHAEGLHARNKLLMPAPLLPLRARMHADSTSPPMETAIVQDTNMLREALVHFPHLEELTLRNCWITPSALLQFVKVHDEYALKHLALEFVSLTATLRPSGNAQAAHAGQQAILLNAPPAQLALWAHGNNNAGGNAAPANNVPGNGQVLNIHIQNLHAQLQQMQANAGGVQQHQQVHVLQTQLQQQLQNAHALTQNVQALTAPQAQAGAPQATMQFQQAQQQLQQQQQHAAQIMHLAVQVNFLQNAMANQNAQANAATSSASATLQTPAREGSWIDIIDQISPGTNLSDFESMHSKVDANRATSLMSISFVSCGYAKLPHLGLSIDQSAIEAVNGFAAATALRNPIFTKRYNALSPAMMSSKWQYLGEIVQEVNLNEYAALDAGWNLRHGWEDAEAARAVEFDGLLSGGTGRFTGKVQRSDRVETEAKYAS
ncbi:uncharacterized protein M421DRAFT_422052 [Didymella exigua CBS 183.55]|uniref:F-box domain-containing protein n=1 Tax=Didymella exigua CBS 183.55 TaxID=1150837 RepID=A0A6A5RJN9_9PLEO|nr:uncharacterized protein M421DRAFT_422052 [Didymella exigua CBS 183.55]KAF1927194.1 hypothetical protein M421DRAFT_422052 [Didymella exigua CBS 183.55]